MLELKGLTCRRVSAKSNITLRSNRFVMWIHNCDLLWWDCLLLALYILTWQLVIHFSLHSLHVIMNANILRRTHTK